MNASVTLEVSAPPEKVWELVADVTNTGRFSPETFEAEWLDGASGPGVGTRFRGHVKRNGRGPVYWTTCRITECDPGRVFEFTVENRGKPVNTWRYDVEPTEGGCAVTESFRLADTAVLRFYWALAGRARGRTNREGMRTTLERLKAVAESGDSGAPASG